jgi:hypothetical protein
LRIFKISSEEEGKVQVLLFQVARCEGKETTQWRKRRKQTIKNPPEIFLSFRSLASPRLVEKVETPYLNMQAL